MSLPKYKPQHRRLQFIAQHIKEKRFPNCSTLAAEYGEISAKTILRDIDYMKNQLDAPIAFSKQMNGYYYTEEQYDLPAFHIRESDLFALYLADKLLGQYEGTPMYDSLCSIFKKIEDNLPNSTTLLSRVAQDQERFTIFPPFSTVIQPDILKTVFDGLRASQTIWLRHRRPGRESVEREIDPYHALRFDGDWYVLAFCHLRGRIQVFSLSRILEVRLTEKTFQIPKDFSCKTILGSHFGIHWGQENCKVRILFTAEAAPYVRERKWHSSQEITENTDGSIILTVLVNHLFDLQRWILSWGAEAEVLEPLTLRDDLQKIVQEMGRIYA